MNPYLKKYFLIIFCLFVAFFQPFAFTSARAQSIGGITSGSAIYCASFNSGFVNLDFGTYNGSIIRWESSVDGGNTWAPLFNITASQSYDQLIQSTCFRAIVKDGAFPDSASTISCINIYPTSDGGKITGDGKFCIVPGTGDGTLTLTDYVADTVYWQYSTDAGISWTSLPDTTTTLNYTNTTQNTLYWAIVRNGPSQCLTDTSLQASFSYDSITVAGVLASSDTVCPLINGNTINLSANVGGVLDWLTSIDNGLSWLPVTDTSTSLTYSGLLSTTWYKTIIKNGACNADTTQHVAITIVPNPISAGNDTAILLGESIVLSGAGNGTAFWTPPVGLDSTNIFKPTATPATDSVYYVLTLTDNHSCISIDSVLITTYVLEFNNEITSLFTPNGDGINDTWHIKDIENYPDSEVFIYNIYGHLLYTKKGYTNDWQGTFNGSKLPDGTYYYVLRFDEDDVVKKGSLDILSNK